MDEIYPAIFVACLGLFGLTSFSVEQRTKEIGIRKVLGASESGLVLMISGEFIWLVLLANLVACPLAYWMMNQWLANFVYRIDVGVMPFVMGGLFTFAIALTTVGFKPGRKRERIRLMLFAARKEESMKESERSRGKQERVRRMGRTDSYLICATPRTGSTLLCGLLTSTEVAGRPESYFRQPDEQMWAARWDIVRSSDEVFEYSEFVRAAIAAGRTQNGVFAARIMWGTLDYVVDKLGAVYPAITGGDIDLLNRVFGHTRFVYLQRDDVLAQAVSWRRTEQTNVWFETDQSELEQPEQELRFDFDQICKLVQMINEHNAAWRAWFASVGIQPYLVRYEDLATNPVGVTCGILDFLKLELPPEREIQTRHRADDLNAQWINRYRAEQAERLSVSSESEKGKYESLDPISLIKEENMADSLHFVHISDTHLGHLRDWVALGNNPFHNLLRVLEAINSLPTRPQFVIHTGDVANHNTEVAYELAAEAFSQINIPIYFVTGNHDTRDYMRVHLTMGPKEDVLSNSDLNCYRFSYQGERFLVLDTQQPYEEAGHFGKVTEDQLDFVRAEVSQQNGSLTVFMHHSPLDLDSKWYSRDVGMLNGTELHEALLPARERLRGVFFGHVHRGTHIHKDGIAYISVGSTFCQLNYWPNEQEVNFDEEHPPCFNFVTFHEDRMIVKEHSVSVKGLNVADKT